MPKNYSNLDISKCLVKEGQKIEKYLKGYVVILNIVGENLTSEGLAEKIEKISQSNDTITFVIGGSYGLSEDIKSKGNMHLSFSKMTFPHQLFRVMLLEQIYRSATISNNIIYHK